MIPDMAVQPHTLQQEFALINVNIPNVIVEQVKWIILVLPLGRSLILTDLENLLNVSCNTHFCFFPFQKRSKWLWKISGYLQLKGLVQNYH